MLKKCSLIALVSIACSCEKVLDVDIVNENPKLVINALFMPDSTWLVDLSRNAHILDPRPVYPPVAGALVTILNQKNEIVETLSYGKIKDYRSYPPQERGVYVGKTIPMAGEVYTIKAETVNSTPVQATSQTPSATHMAILEMDSSKDQSGQRIDMKIRFTDPADEMNYYQIKILMKTKTRSWSPPSTGRKDTIVTSYESEVRYGSVDESPEINTGNVFPDTYFNGKEKIVHIAFRPQSTFSSLYSRQELYDCRVVLLSVSEEYYKYFSSINLYNESSNNPLAQPVQIFNNVENGFGIFAGYSASMVRIK